MRKKYKTTGIVIIGSISILLVTGLIIWQDSIAIKYHNQRINALLNRKPKLDPITGLGYFGDDWINAFDKHRDKLVGLGYLQRKEFPLSNISVPSLESRRLWEELSTTFPNNPYKTMQGYEPNTPDEIIVWDQPDNLTEWERVISAHDAPPTNIVDGSQIGDVQDLLHFVGYWGTEEGEVCYIISNDAEGSLKIETSPNEAWRTILKNIRIEGKRILFDQFNYTDPNEDYKSIIDNSGEHPFSGVRCETVFEVNPMDSNELFESMSAVSKNGILTDPNKYILRRLK